MMFPNRGLSALRAGDFAGLLGVRFLGLHNNELGSLPEAPFEDMPALLWLFLDGNELEALPPGLFRGLRDLRTLRLHDNPGAPFALPADRACGTRGALCTADGDRLTSRVEITIAGPGG